MQSVLFVVTTAVVMRWTWQLVHCLYIPLILAYLTLSPPVHALRQPDATRSSLQPDATQQQYQNLSVIEPRPIFAIYIEIIIVSTYNHTYTYSCSTTMHQR